MRLLFHGDYMLVIERFMAFICRQAKLRNAAEKYAILFLRLIMTVSISRSRTGTLCLSICLTLYSKQLNCRLMRLRTEHTLLQQQFKLCGCSWGRGYFLLDKQHLIASFTSLFPIIYLLNCALPCFLVLGLNNYGNIFYST